MARKKQVVQITRGDVLSSARPIILVAIQFLMRTKRFAPHSNALLLLSVAVDKLLPESDNHALVTVIRETHRQLDGLWQQSSTKQHKVLAQLKNQIAQL